MIIMQQNGCISNYELCIQQFYIFLYVNCVYATKP